MKGHLWEIQGEREDGRRTGHVTVSRAKDGPRESVVPGMGAFLKMIDDGAVKVHVYHTHPSPGPTRRYVGWYGPGGVFHDCRR